MITPITDIEENVTLYGIKAVNLKKLTSIGIRVPNGFVIDRDSFDKPEKILDMYDDMGHSEVVVRSSFYESDKSVPLREVLYNDVEVDRDTLISSINTAIDLDGNVNLAHLLSTREVDVSDISLAVIVQELIHPLISGSAYALDPIYGDTNKIIIECIEGSPEMIVNGTDTPNTYVIDKTKLEVVQSTVRSESVDLVFRKYLENNLINMILDIGESFGSISTLQWAWMDKKIYVLEYDN